MNKRAAMGAALGISLLIVLGAAIYVTHWDTKYGSPQSIDYDPTPDVDTNGDGINDRFSGDSLNSVLFETYGPVLLVLATLMFGAMIGGVCIAREEVEKDDSD